MEKIDAYTKIEFLVGKLNRLTTSYDKGTPEVSDKEWDDLYFELVTLEQEWEYMFVFSKGKPNAFNPIMIPCKYAGQETWGSVSYHKTSDSGLVKQGKKKINDFKQHGNIFEYMTGSIKSKKGVRHPAPFPEALAEDMISSWSNVGDLVLDPFAGNCSLAEACINTNRQYICIEIDKQYYDLGKKRVEGKSYRPQKNQEQVSLF